MIRTRVGRSGSPGVGDHPGALPYGWRKGRYEQGHSVPAPSRSSSQISERPLGLSTVCSRLLSQSYSRFSSRREMEREEERERNREKDRESGPLHGQRTTGPPAVTATPAIIARRETTESSLSIAPSNCRPSRAPHGTGAAPIPPRRSRPGGAPGAGR